METLEKMPKLEPIDKGNTYKTLKVTAEAGMVMPTHYATSEAVVTILKGEGVLIIDDEKHTLKEGECFIIPSNKNHSLEIKKDFKAIIVMAADGNIKF